MSLLFMCVANSARSQLAEGLARKMFPTLEIQSAGSQPGKLNPYAVQVTKEIGIDISDQYSKSIEQLSPKFIADITFIITLCAEEVCPIVLAPNARKLHWPLPDPASKVPLSDEEMTRRFREARDSIQNLLLKFKEELST